MAGHLTRQSNRRAVIAAINRDGVVNFRQVPLGKLNVERGADDLRNFSGSGHGVIPYGKTASGYKGRDCTNRLPTCNTPTTPARDPHATRCRVGQSASSIMRVATT